MVSEVFYAVQGEGCLAGAPSVFVVSADGPPRQSWIGQKEKAWTPDPQCLFGTLLANVRNHWCHHVVIVGAEPLQNPELQKLIDGIVRFDHHVTVETSGAVYAPISCSLLSINARLKNPIKPHKKTKPARLDYDIEILRKLVRSPHQIKFDVSDRSEMEEIKGLVQEIAAERSNVVLTPTATSGKAVKEQAAWILEASRFFGYRYVPRFTA